MKLPLEDGDKFVDSQGRAQVVAGSIRKSFGGDEYNHRYCWTIKGNWFRREDGVEVTGAFRDKEGNPVTVSEAYKLRAQSYKGS